MLHRIAGSPRRDASNGSESCRMRCPHPAPGKVCADVVGAPPLEILDDRQSYGADGFTLLTVLQPQAACFGIGLRPFQADHLATSAAGQRNLADDATIVVYFSCLAASRSRLSEAQWCSDVSDHLFDTGSRSCACPNQRRGVRSQAVRHPR